MSDRPEQRPEGRLIELALKRTRSSIRKAAAEVPISEGRLRQIINGYETRGAGVHLAVRAPAETLASIARAFGITPEQLEGADRADAAAELRDLLTTEPTPPASETDRVKLAHEKIREAQRLMQEAQQILGGDTAETDEPRRSAG